jgi:hypothetical protein
LKTVKKEPGDGFVEKVSRAEKDEPPSHKESNGRA